jgi:hypothetical protein
MEQQAAAAATATAAAARLLSVEDVILKILLRVAPDAAALFRCAVACKRWCALVADRSFLRRCWPENAGRPSTLLGFFTQQRVYANGRRLLFFVPPPGAVSVLYIYCRRPPGGLLGICEAAHRTSWPPLLD